MGCLWVHPSAHPLFISHFVKFTYQIKRVGPTRAEREQLRDNTAQIMPHAGKTNLALGRLNKIASLQAFCILQAGI